jgi:dTDP-4-dehydrorhamnose reductase
MSDTRPLLVTGAGGLLGAYVCRLLVDKGFDVVGTYRKKKPVLERVKLVKCDITDFEQVEKVFETYNPSAVFHAAALTLVSYCEEHPGEAFRVNSDATMNLVRACRQIRAVPYYVSTMYVFDGDNAPYRETDSPNPLNIYAKSKFFPEKAVLDSGGVVVRPTVVYGWNPFGRKNFCTWLIGKLSDGEETNVFTDLVSTPIYAGTLADVVIKLYEKSVKGVFHVCCSSSVSREEFAKTVCDVFGFDRGLLKPVRYDDHVELRRPLDDSADVSKVERTLGARMPSLKDDLLRMKKDFQVFKRLDK